MMDLLSSTSDGSWNPFTSLIHVTTQEAYELLFVPVLEYNDARLYSTALHEITHAWCARTTRLGWYFSRIAAEGFSRWADQKANWELPASAQILLGAYTPLLEGVALFAQLDFEADDDENLLPNPLTLTLDTFGITWQNRGRLGWRALFRHIRNEARFPRPSEDNPEVASVTLAEKLFLDTYNEHQNFYLFGYLYIRTIAAIFERQYKGAGTPLIFLPLIIRLLFDHPVIERVLQDSLSPQQLLHELHKTIVAVAEEKLPLILGCIHSHPELHANFDLWDIHAHLKNGEWATPVYHQPGAANLFFSAEDRKGEVSANQNALYRYSLNLRASASIYLTGWRQGTLVEVNGNAFTLQAEGEKLPGRIAPCSQFYWNAASEEINPTEMGIASQAMYALEENFRCALRRLEHQEVTIAQFFTWTRGTAGAALWYQNSLQAWYSFVPTPFMLTESGRFGLELDTLFSGLTLSPMERNDFLDSLVKPTLSGDACRTATKTLLSFLVSDPRTQMFLRRQRLMGLEGGKHEPALRTWARFHPFQYTALAPAVIQSLDTLFDLPGFQPLSKQVNLSWSDIMPSFLPAEYRR